MFMNSTILKTKRIALAALLLSAVTLLGCLGDSDAAKKRLLETGNKYYDTGKYKEASIIYKKVLQKDQRYGEALDLVGAQPIEDHAGQDGGQIGIENRQPRAVEAVAHRLTD